MKQILSRKSCFPLLVSCLFFCASCTQLKAMEWFGAGEKPKTMEEATIKGSPADEMRMEQGRPVGMERMELGTMPEEPTKNIVFQKDSIKPLYQVADQLICIDGYVKDVDICRECRSDSECVSEYPKSPGACDVTKVCRCDPVDSFVVCKLGAICDSYDRTCRPCESDDECMKTRGSIYRCHSGRCQEQGQMAVKEFDADEFCKKVPSLPETTQDEKDYKHEMTQYCENLPPKQPRPTYSGPTSPAGKPGRDPSGTTGVGQSSGAPSAGGCQGPKDCPSKEVWDAMKWVAKTFLGAADKVGIKLASSFPMQKVKGFSGSGLKLLDIANWASTDYMVVGYETKEKTLVGQVDGKDAYEIRTRDYLNLWSKAADYWKGDATYVRHLPFGSPYLAEPRLRGLTFSGGYYYALIEWWSAGIAGTITMQTSKIVRIGIGHDPNTNQWLSADKGFGEYLRAGLNNTKQKITGEIDVFSLFEEYFGTSKLLTFNNVDPSFKLGGFETDGANLVFFISDVNKDVYFVSVPIDGRTFDSNQKPLYTIKKLKYIKAVPEFMQYASKLSQWVAIDRMENPTQIVSMTKSGTELVKIPLSGIKRLLYGTYSTSANPKGEFYVLYTKVGTDPKRDMIMLATFGGLTAGISPLNNAAQIAETEKPDIYEFAPGVKRNVEFHAAEGALIPLPCHGEKVAVWLEKDTLNGWGYYIAMAMIDGSNKMSLDRKLVYDFAIDSYGTASFKRFDIYSPFFVSPEAPTPVTAPKSIADLEKFGVGLIYKIDKIDQKNEHNEEILYQKFKLKVAPDFKFW